MRLFVIIPVFNEQKTLPATLARLAGLVDTDFRVVLCDNGSTDGSGDLARRFIADRGLDWSVIDEAQKGTGAASDTAAREAIRLGATHLARTDADCLPAADWTARIRAIFDSTDLRFIAGMTHPRGDDLRLGGARVAVLKLVNEVAIAFGKLRPSNKGPQYLGPYLMASGNNLAITAELYLECGGFTRTAIEDAHEDRALVMAIRRVTDRSAFRRDVLVLTSARRIQAWGIVRSLGWYAGHYYRPPKVDIR